MNRRLGMAFALLAGAFSGGAAIAEGDPVSVTGEVIDTWCYFSGVMGGPEAVVGSAHHTCAMWCAAGGIPVGVLADDGTVYMVMKWQGDPAIADGTAMLDAQSHRITAKGTLYVRDGINYLMVAEIAADDGIVNRSHEDFGVVPPFAIPEL
ncbi:hypothetical protein H0I76_14925 [Limibaculum sp. M0105]|uniref:Uncharacterized protein n=1 Tax=Thermohalobaculum xanthum TaxID=2753746 RepID=A0A8J7MAA7_9RHOB|nr:hypothetical protein [Thermohalobaculum xanthum]MBK0400492.1 hypothetical protein [Thermohalobaculum xanthum]